MRVYLGSIRSSLSGIKLDVCDGASRKKGRGFFLNVGPKRGIIQGCWLNFLENVKSRKLRKLSHFAQGEKYRMMTRVWNLCHCRGFFLAALVLILKLWGFFRIFQETSGGKTNKFCRE